MITMSVGLMVGVAGSGRNAQEDASDTNAGNRVVSIIELQKYDYIQGENSCSAYPFDDMREEHGPRCQDLAPEPDHLEDSTCCRDEGEENVGNLPSSRVLYA